MPIGCYKEDRAEKSLYGAFMESNELSTSECIRYCRFMKYEFAGLQGGNKLVSWYNNLQLYTKTFLIIFQQRLAHAAACILFIFSCPLFRICRCHCGTKVYAIYGLEEDRTACSVRCTGDNNEYCGGVLSNDVYITTSIEKCSPTNLGKY